MKISFFYPLLPKVLAGLFVKYLILIVAFLLSFQMGYTQKEKIIDSLLGKLETQLPDKERVAILTELATQHEANDSALSVGYGEKAIKLAKKIGYTEGSIAPLYPIAVSNLRKGYYQKAKKIFSEMEELAQKHDYQDGMARARYGLGWLHMYLGQFDKALSYLHGSTDFTRKQGKKKELALNYNLIGIAYDKQGNFNKALEYYFLSLEINEELGLKTGMAANYGNIGIIYVNQGDFSKALNYYHKALEINKSMNRKQGMTSNYNNIGMIQMNKKEFEGALTYFEQSLKISTELSDKRGIANAHYHIGKSYSELGKYPIALENLFTSLDLYIEMGMEANKSFPNLTIGDIYRKQNQLLKSRRFLKEGLNLARETGEKKNIRDGAQILADVEHSLGNYKAALEAHILFKQTNDSLIDQERIKKITLLEAEYAFQKERDSVQFVQQQEMLQMRAEAKKAEFRKQAAFIGICILLTAGIVLYVIQNRVRERRKIQSLRNRISRDLHDEIGSTLSSISLFGLVAEKTVEEDPEKAQQLLSQINKSALQTIESMNDIVWAINGENDTLLHLVNRMRSFASEIEDTGSWDIQIDLDPVLSGTTLNMIQRRNLYLIYKEAVNNALKYSKGTAIHIEIRQTQKLIRMEVKDDGQGFDTKALFEEEKSGSLGGNGLKNMQMRAEELEGDLKIQSTQGLGTLIIVEFDPGLRPKFH